MQVSTQFAITDECVYTFDINVINMQKLHHVVNIVSINKVTFYTVNENRKTNRKKITNI